MMKGLVIRWFSGGYFLCDGKAPAGFENDGDLHVGNTIRWFEAWEAANDMRNIINAAYGVSDHWEESIGA